jgi:uncharacterized membrane-anchored protein
MRMRAGKLGGLMLLGAATLAANPASAGKAAGGRVAGDKQAQSPKSASSRDPAQTPQDEPHDKQDKPKYQPIIGPQKVDLGHGLEIDLPESFLFLEHVQAGKLMETLGNFENQNLLGVIAQPESSWMVTIRYVEDGYVKDDEAEKMDADEILKAIKEGTDEANKERETKGFKALHVMGWSEPPRYARDHHHLVWGVRVKSDDDPEEAVNFNTRVLGRAGFASLNLVDSASKIEASKPAAATLLAATHYKPGSRYEDFDSKKDKVAEYGLAALVLGGAGAVALKLVKVGLIAKFAGKILALLIALKKAIILVIVAIFAFFKRVLGLGKKDAPAGAVASPVVSVESPSIQSPAGESPAASAVEQHPGEGDPGGKNPA